MGNTDTHDCKTERLSDYVDDELSPDAAAAVEEHLTGCRECRGIVHELKAVAARAGALADSPPDRDLWPGIEARIDRGADAPRVLEMRPGRRFTFTFPQLVAASLALMLLSGSMVWLARLGGDRTDFPAVGAAVPEPIVVPATFADTQYDAAIADLQQTLEAERAKLDPRTIRVLEQNLAAIDRAIEQCREALASDPSNAYLADHLAAAKKRKLALLRRASALTFNSGT